MEGHCGKWEEEEEEERAGHGTNIERNEKGY
jgi:hypothetical protein